MNTFYKLAATFLGIISCTAIMKTTADIPVYSQNGSTGVEVEEIQRVLQERGLFNGSITGYYGAQTEKAVLAFQKQQGLAATGIADNATLKRLGITIGSLPRC